MVQRCTYRRRKSFRTASNAVRKVKTPGGELVLHYVGKKGNGPACGDCKKRLHGIPALRPCEYKRISKRQKNVSRAYGGSRCATCVRQRIVLAVGCGRQCWMTAPAGGDGCLSTSQAFV